MIYIKILHHVWSCFDRFLFSFLHIVWCDVWNHMYFRLCQVVRHHHVVLSSGFWAPCGKVVCVTSPDLDARLAESPRVTWKIRIVSGWVWWKAVWMWIASWACWNPGEAAPKMRIGLIGFRRSSCMEWSIFGGSCIALPMRWKRPELTWQKPYQPTQKFMSVNGWRMWLFICILTLNCMNPWVSQSLARIQPHQLLNLGWPRPRVGLVCHILSASCTWQEAELTDLLLHLDYAIWALLRMHRLLPRAPQLVREIVPRRVLDRLIKTLEYCQEHKWDMS